MDLGGWLRSLGLEQYEAAFRENAIDDTVLPNLTAEDLKDLGVGIVGHRRKLLMAIAALRTDTTEKAPPTDAPPATDITAKDAAERRQVTVLFCDLVGSTELAPEMDPGISAPITVVSHEVDALNGFVAKYMGDGVLVYFGYPQAHEDDAERAVRTGLAIIKAVGQLQTSCRLQVRIGIGTGLVVVGDLIGMGESQERGIVGETPNLAARLQAMAEPGSIVIGPQTHLLLGNLFEYRDLGPHAIKGFAKPVLVRQVLGASKLDDRFEAMHQSGTSPLLGREEELDLLMRRWEQIKRGEGRVVVLTGEPGIGKSRLARALGERVRSEPHTPLIYHCSPYHQDSALYPVTSQLLRANIERDDDTDTKLNKLEALLAQSSENLVEDMPLFAAQVSIPGGERYTLPNFTPQRLRERTLDALLRQLFKAGSEARRAKKLLGYQKYQITLEETESCRLLERLRQPRYLTSSTGSSCVVPSWRARWAPPSSGTISFFTESSRPPSLESFTSQTKIRYQEP
jgi:class 3 adenylate cyclase